ncbi:MAG: tetratricopeptide repeat protein [Thermodesulfobacteriota bacterium]
MSSGSGHGGARRHRVVRLFVSSTFRDTRKERDDLVNRIFPELQRRCRERFVDFVYVDLRWGITDEDSRHGDTIRLCLRQVDECRPYFVGILGELYGWVPDSIERDLVKEMPWLAEHPGKSVTELEILHAALNDPVSAVRSFFFFRDSGYMVRIPLEERKNYASQSKEAKAKLDALKDRIRQSGLPVKENYTDPTALGNMVLEDLWTAIDADFPAHSIPDALDREAAEHEAYAASRARVYIGRAEYFQRLDDHVNGNGPPLVITGESGAGKSALLANWANRYVRAHPDAFVVLHFIGGTPQSSDYLGLVHRILGEIKRRYGLRRDIPSKPGELCKALPEWLAVAGSKGTMVLILDALNQLENRDNCLELEWLPNVMPPHVRLLVSSLSGPTLTALKVRKWPELEVTPLQPEERRDLVAGYLGRYGKKLSTVQMDRVSHAHQCSNPLYLRALLDELRQFGSYEKIDEKIDDCLAAETIPALYEKVLERLEGDFDKERGGLVKDSLSLLWAARRGLYESELLGCLGYENIPLPIEIWSPFGAAIQEWLVSKAGLLGFVHDYLRHAVQTRYLANTDAQKGAHLTLARYFGRRKTDTRRIEELPWQLTRAERWKDLLGCIKIPSMFRGLFAGEQIFYELCLDWKPLGERFDLEEALNGMLEKYRQNGAGQTDLADAVHEAGSFLWLLDRHEGAEALHRRELAMREEITGMDDRSVADVLDLMGGLACDKGDLDGAEARYRRALEIIEKTVGLHHPDLNDPLAKLAAVLEYKDDPKGAEALHRRRLEILEDTFGQDHPDFVIQALVDLARTLIDQRTYEYATVESLYRRALAIMEKDSGRDYPHAIHILETLAFGLQDQQDYNGAEVLFRRALAIREKESGPDHPDVICDLDRLAQLLWQKRDYDGAEALFRRALAIRENDPGTRRWELLRNLRDLACLLADKGEHDESEAFCWAAEFMEKANDGS